MTQTNDTPAMSAEFSFDLCAVGKDAEGNILFALNADEIKHVKSAIKMLDAVGSGGLKRDFDGQKLLGECRDEEYGYNNGFNACLKQLKEIADGK